MDFTCALFRWLWRSLLLLLVAASHIGSRIRSLHSFVCPSSLCRTQPRSASPNNGVLLVRGPLARRQAPGAEGIPCDACSIGGGEGGRWGDLTSPKSKHPCNAGRTGGLDRGKGVLEACAAARPLVKPAFRGSCAGTRVETGFGKPPAGGSNRVET